MTIELIAGIAAAISIIVMVTTFLSFTQARRTREHQELMRYMMIDRMDYLRRDILGAKTPRVSIAEEKKEAIQKMGPKTFYYIDESQIKDLYLQVYQELEPKRVETREIEKVKGGITGKLKLLEPKFEKGKAKEVTKVYDVEQTPAIMYNKVEQFLLDKSKVILGLDEFEFEKSSIDDFKSMCEHMRSKFNFDVPDELRDTFVSDKMREFALQYVEKLASSSGYVALQNEFLVVDISDDGYMLSFRHPLNEYLRPEDPKVIIQIICAKRYMSPSGVSTFKKGKSVKITSFGKVVSWNDEDKVLEISPIAMY